MDSVDAYVPANDTWYTLSQMPTARCYASATSWNNTVVVAGGYPECNLKSVQQYDLLTNTWTSLPRLIKGRRGLSLVNLDGTLLAIGGCNTYTSVEQFDEDAQQWKLTTPLTFKRRRFAAVVFMVSFIL